MKLKYRVLCAALALAITSPLAAQQTTANEFVIDLNLPDGTRERVLYAAPAHPQATLVMLPGGAGELGLRRDGDIRHDDNFVVRTRSLWVTQNYAVLIPDTIDRENLRGLRSSAEVQLARTKATVPVFLLGTSQGSIAAMNGGRPCAARYDCGRHPHRVRFTPRS